MRKIESSIKAVILYLDQTLTIDQGSWIQFTNLIGADSVAHTDIYEKFKAGDLSYSDAKSKLIDLWRLTGKTNKKDIEMAFSKIKFRNGAIEAVEYLKQKYKVCIISGAIDVFVEIASRRLGIDSWYASTKFIFDSSESLIDFHYKLSRGEEKLSFLQEFCRKNAIKESDCAAIGDGDSDMPLFKKIEFPILFVAAETTDQQKRNVKIHLNNWNEIYDIL